jgi:CRISPR-associated protein Csx3
MITPAVLIGGPPHSGKSTLAYRVSRALQDRNIPHYLLRANPDGEGAWSYLAEPTTVDSLRARARANWSPLLASRLARDVSERLLPLIVDLGGAITEETAQIAERCTHTVLVTPDEETMQQWRLFVRRYGLAPVAELTSQINGTQSIITTLPILRGILTGLDRDQFSIGSCFDALVDRIARLFTYDADQLFHAHLSRTSLDLVLNVEREIYPLPAHRKENWQPRELPRLLASLPPHQPLGIYGRGPAWLYAALAAVSPQQPCEVFDIRGGWITPPVLALAEHPDPTRLNWSATVTGDTIHLRFNIPGSYIDWRDAEDLPVPRLDPAQSVILDGKLPQWLWAALARTYADLRFVAVFQPQLPGAIVVHSTDSAFPLGTILADTTMEKH